MGFAGNLLVVSYLFPPAGNVGVLRTLRFVRRLAESGWDPVVLTARNGKVHDLEPSLLRKVPSSVPVYKSYAFELFNDGKRVDLDASESNGGPSLLTRIARKVPRDLWQYFAIPDEKLGWVPFAARAAKRIIREHDVDAIYVTGKPFSSYLVGHRLSRRFGIPWVMDLRDLWTLNRRVRPKNWLRKVVEPRLERRLVRSASVVVVNTPGNRDDFVAAFPECLPEKFVTITNGYDGDDFVDLDSTKNEKFTIAYFDCSLILTDLNSLCIQPFLTFGAQERRNRWNGDLKSDWRNSWTMRSWIPGYRMGCWTAWSGSLNRSRRV